MNYFRVGDVYEFKTETNCYGLLVTKKELENNTFTVIHNYQEGINKDDFLTTCSIKYHKRSLSIIEKILTMILGGDNPEGYFGFTVSTQIIKKFQNLHHRLSLNKLNSDDLFQIGGTSLVRENELELIINHSQNFKMHGNRNVDLEYYA